MIIFLIVLFASLSFLIIVNMFYPQIERIHNNWQRGRIEKITPRLDSMFIDVPYRKLLIIDILIPLVIGVLVFITTRIFSAALAAAFVGIILSSIIVKRMEIARRMKFTGQLIDGLMLLSGSLKAGLSLLQSFEALVEEMPAPISQEFSLVLKENRMGVTLEECLVKLKRRMQCDELDMLVTAVLVARETGGDLTTIFTNMVKTIRERNRLLSRVKALCSQGKLQGRIMMLLPIVFGYGVYKFDPTFFNALMNDPQGRMMLGYAVVSEILGMFFIIRLSKVEV
ncbi:MAG TPA: type II secretion system F family protein [Candidatus Omnitrophota bacterium]|nr:type II secretion system F family protein [Candidatus Omnitrophota bacterium]